jgi:antitoxin (DNA-binding transcriptional repressor) of toxin-antitoxin stability system
MLKVGSREFKNRMGRYMLVIRKGDTLLVTDRGKPLAKVCPPDQDAQPSPTLAGVLNQLEQEGKIRLGRRPLGKFRPVRVKGKPASRTIIEDRR